MKPEVSRRGRHGVTCVSAASVSRHRAARASSRLPPVVVTAERNLRNKADKTGFSLILNGWFIYAMLY